MVILQYLDTLLVQCHQVALLQFCSTFSCHMALNKISISTPFYHLTLGVIECLDLLQHLTVWLFLYFHLTVGIGKYHAAISCFQRTIEHTAPI